MNRPAWGCGARRCGSRRTPAFACRKQAGGSRRNWLAAVAVLVAFAPVVRAQIVSPSGGMTHQFRYLMGTSMEVRAYNGDEATRTVAIDEAFAAMAEVDRLMSNYRDDSELAGLTANGAAGPVHVSDALFSVIDAAQQVSDQSGGAFDITVGPLMKLWGFHDKKLHVPTVAELNAIRPLVNYRNLQLDRATRTIAFARPGVDIDLGGIAKGFASELAANVLKRYGLAGFVDCGGNQYMLGLPPGKESWTVGVRDPDHPDRLLGVIDTTGGGASTAAAYGTFLAAGATHYGHIMNPHTLRPSTASLSVTVVGPDGTLADAVSNAAFVLGPERGIAVIDSFPNLAGLIVYRGADARTAIAISKGLAGHFHPVAS